MRTFEARSAAAKRAAQTRRTLRHMKAGPTVAEIVTECKYCPLHAAAEEMREALELYMLAVGNTGAHVDAVSVRVAYEKARAALAKAEGKA